MIAGARALGLDPGAVSDRSSAQQENGGGAEVLPLFFQAQSF